MKLIRNLSCILACGLLFSCGGGGGGGGGETVEAPETLVPESPEKPASTYSFTVKTSEMTDGQDVFTMEFVCSGESGAPQGTIESCKVDIPGYGLPVLTGGNWVQTVYSSGDELHELKFTCEGNNSGVYYKMELLIHTLLVREYVPESYLLGKTYSADAVIRYESGDRRVISVHDRHADITITYH